MEKNHKTIILFQIVFLVVVVTGLYFFYPKVEQNVSGNIVKFHSGNSDFIIVSKSPDFSSPRFVNFEKEDVYVQLEPGIYYWKPANNLIKGVTRELIIESEVGVKINRNESNESVEIENIGNVKINITKDQEGKTVGYIILDTGEKEKIDDKERYEAREK